MKKKIIKELYKLCEKASKKNEVPISALIVKNNKIIAKAYNKKNQKNISFYHAEIIVIKKASKILKTWNLNDCELYVTLEPCDMCKYVIAEARINKVFYFIKSNYNLKISSVKYEQMYDSESFVKIIKKFFKKLR